MSNVDVQHRGIAVRFHFNPACGRVVPRNGAAWGNGAAYVDYVDHNEALSIPFLGTSLFSDPVVAQLFCAQVVHYKSGRKYKLDPAVLTGQQTSETRTASSTSPKVAK